MTRAGRKVLDYEMRKQAKGEPFILGEMMRVCGFSCRANAKRARERLKKMGLLIN